MSAAPVWCFGPFRLDPANACLWRDAELLSLRPKPFAVLAYLVACAGQVVHKDTLLEEVWPEAVVSEGVLKDYINQIRKILGDTAHTPQYIATVHRRGYRFVAPVIEDVSSPADPDAMSLSSASADEISPHLALRSRCAADVPQSAHCGSPVVDTLWQPHNPAPLVAREAELAQLQQWWAMAQHGQRQLGFIAGETGIGKTALVDAFVAQLAVDQALSLGHGQCIEPYGAGEPYLPLLEAFGRLGRAPDGAHLVNVLQQCAPSWLAQLPALWTVAPHTNVSWRAQEATREGMLRELAEAVEVLTAERPLLLILEDLHWSDTSTLEWLAYVARRRQPARLLILGTYRPVDAIVRGHPLHIVVPELQRHRQCEELALNYLPSAGVAAYLTWRFTGKTYPHALVPLLHQRTNGNPLFLVTAVDDMVRRAVLQEGTAGVEMEGGVEAIVTGVPESLRYLIEQQLDQMGPLDQALLETASVAGMVFATPTVAVGMTAAVVDMEERCAILARQQQFVQARGTAEWPDGTLAAQYGFRHAFYHEVCYERVPVARRMQLHRQIGLQMEASHGSQAREIAAELAMHFVQGRDSQRAVQYLHIAGQNALRRSAHQEAISHLTTALELLTTLPDTVERAEQALTLSLALGPAYIVTRGHAAPEVEQVYIRAQALCQQLGDSPQFVLVLQGLWTFYNGRHMYQKARVLGAQYLALARQAGDPVTLLEAHIALGITLFRLGELVTARRHLEEGATLYDPQRDRARLFSTGQDPGVVCLTFLASVLVFLGYPEQAWQRCCAALRLAQERAHPYSLVFAQYRAGLHALFCRQAQTAQELAEAVLSLAATHGFAFFEALGKALKGWALAMQGQAEAGLASMHQGLTALSTTGSPLSTQWVALQAEVYAALGRPADGLSLLAPVLAGSNSADNFYIAELHRLKGALLWHDMRQRFSGESQQWADVEACLQQALVLARQQQAKALELRAALSLSRLWQQQGKVQLARHMLAEIYAWFTEGFDTVDLQEARALLDALQT